MGFLAGWGKRKEIKYGSTIPGENLTDFPKLFNISADSDIAAELGSGGGIAVTGSDGETTVPFGLHPSSSEATGDLVLMAKFTMLTAASTGDTIGYIYYDSGQSTTEDHAGVVSASVSLYMPLGEDPSGSAPQMYDWVSESNVGTSVGSMTGGDLIDAQVGKGLDLDSNDCVTVPDANGLDPVSGTLTVEILGKQDTSTNAFLINKRASGAIPGWDILIGPGGSSGAAQGRVGNATTAYASSNKTGLNDGAWHSYALVMDGSNLKFYVDGSQVGSDTAFSSSVNISTQLTIGARNGADAFFARPVDEVMISTVARSANWLSYRHSDQFSNASTFSLGSEETSGGTANSYYYNACQALLAG